MLIYLRTLDLFGPEFSRQMIKPRQILTVKKQRKIYSPEEKSRILNAYLSGVPWEVIEKKFGAKRRTVEIWIRQEEEFLRHNLFPNQFKIC